MKMNTEERKADLARIENYINTPGKLPYMVGDKFYCHAYKKQINGEGLIRLTNK